MICKTSFALTGFNIKVLSKYYHLSMEVGISIIPLFPRLAGLSLKEVGEDV
jgi:hypothetical protein